MPILNEPTGHFVDPTTYANTANVLWICGEHFV